MLRARVLGVAAVVACGCGQNSPPAPPPGPAAPAKSALTGPAPAPGTAADPAAAPAEFLRALKAGTVTAAQLTPAFKKLLAPDAAGGAADWQAGQYLAALAPGAGTDAVVSAPAGPDATLVTSTAAGPDGPHRTLVKLVRTPAGVQADWVAVTRHGATVPVTAATLPGAFPALAFVDAALGGARLAGRQVTLAAALLTPDARDKPSPPLGFRFNRFRGDATAATFAPFPDAGGAVTGTLDGPGGKRPFTLKLVKAGDEYRVAEFAAN